MTGNFLQTKEKSPTRVLEEKCHVVAGNGVNASNGIITNK